MYLMYVDESGDPGKHQYASYHFILSGLVVAQNDWFKYLDKLKEFRKSIKKEYGLNLKTEIHASELIRINKTKEYAKISKKNRINILKDFSTQIPIIFDTAKLINICLDKRDFETTLDIQITAWKRLIQRFDTFLKKDAKDKGMILADDTEDKKLRALLRKMRIYNPMPSHFSEATYNATIDNIIEDIMMLSSNHSYFIQTVDVVAHLLYRKEYPKGSLKKYGIEKLFDKFEPILLKKAAKNDDYGIVRK